MSLHKTKRVWDKVSVRPTADGYGIELDNRPVKTPARATLRVPTRALALAIAAEWQAQQEFVDPATMPFTRTANSAIDKVSSQRADVADMLAAYGDSDLLCYRADSPAKLVARQNAAWDPVLDWAAGTLGARLVPRTGVIHVAQAASETDRLCDQVHQFSNFELAGFHDLVALTGSLILAFATLGQYASPDVIWSLSRVDEVWQAEFWGDDDEAIAQESVKRKSFLDAELFVRLVQEKT